MKSVCFLKGLIAALAIGAILVPASASARCKCSDGQYYYGATYRTYWDYPYRYSTGPRYDPYWSYKSSYYPETYGGDGSYYGIGYSPSYNRDGGYGTYWYN